MPTLILRARTEHAGGMDAEMTISRDLLRDALAEGAGELLLVDREHAVRLWLNDRQLIITKATIATADD